MFRWMKPSTPAIPHSAFQSAGFADDVNSAASKGFDFFREQRNDFGRLFRRSADDGCPATARGKRCGQGFGTVETLTEDRDHAPGCEKVGDECRDRAGFRRVADGGDKTRGLTPAALRC